MNETIRNKEMKTTKLHPDTITFEFHILQSLHFCQLSDFFKKELKKQSASIDWQLSEVSKEMIWIIHHKRVCTNRIE